MQISLTGQLEEMVNTKVASGLYNDAAEVGQNLGSLFCPPF
jgi:Arc/MetJ-type ribon-helix-helix transcriptional regulator